MTLVVDASVALEWYLAEPDSDEALSALRGEDVLAAPHLIIAEVCRGAWKAWHRGEIPAEQVSLISRNVGRRFGARLCPLNLLAYRAAAMATELRYSVYECFYLALAEREACELLTADGKLIRRLGGTRYAAMVRPLVAG
jgi:predicted nucleic acid-binding protein